MLGQLAMVRLSRKGWGCFRPFS